MNVERWGWYSIAVNVVLTAINLIVVIASGSLAVGAELAHNLIDLLAAVAVLIGLKISTRKSKAFPYGLYKLENVVTVVLALLVFVAAYEIARDAFLTPAHQATVAPWMLVGLVAATVIPLVFGHFELRAGRAANSPALIANATEYRTHVLTTGMVLVALLTQRFTLPLDRVAALIIAAVIGKTGWDLLADGLSVLLDASLDTDTLVQLWEVIRAEKAVAEVNWVTGHNAGRFRFIEAEVTLRVHDLDKAEAATRRIETQVRQAISCVERVLIHAKPAERTLLCCAAPLADPHGTLSQALCGAPYFALVTVGLTNGTIDEQRVLANPYQQAEKTRGIQIAEWLLTQKVDLVLVGDGPQCKAPIYVFSDAGVEVQETDATTLQDALKSCLSAM
jgi:cation diffusion facilitator family transporter